MPQQDINDHGSPGADAPTPAESSETTSGALIGHYRLLEIIGHGGMGEVWLAEQKEPVRRRVAIKLIKAGMDTREVVARFDSERQALALMDHPAIAKVFEAGSTLTGRPYFVMEYVPGISVTQYCDKHKLTTRQRLEMLVGVCDGVQHAHQKAIIHRDLKPSNILVGEVDGKPMPRIIDFGLAKATSQPLTSQTMFTHEGTIVGTLAYMSPEQADSAGENVDTRTDVYALGVVLYQLLVGALPHDFGKVPLDQILRRLREQDAPRPSTKLRTLGEQSRIIAHDRCADPRTLARQLRGDVDAIALKALEKDRSRRYAGPSELAADIGRYLRNEPVIARPASAWYRASKYIRRHRIGVAITVAAVLLVISFAVAQAFQLQRIKTERDRANRITDFMMGMFTVSSPSEARGNNITAREILDKASKEIDTGLSRDPELQAKMMDVMGTVYERLGLYSRAQPLMGGSAEIRRRVLGPNHPDTLGSFARLGWILQQEGRYAEAEKLQRETLEIQRRVLRPEHPYTLETTARLAITLLHEGRYAEGEKLASETLSIQRRVLAPDNKDTMRSMDILAMILLQEGRYAEAEKLERETLDIQRRVLGPDNQDTLRKINNLAMTLGYEEHYTEAENLYREALNIQRRILGRDHPDTLTLMNNLAEILQKEGRYAEAEKLQRETLEIQRRVLGPEHPYTATSRYNLACLAARQGRRTEALSLVREAIDHGLSPAADLGIEKDPDLQSLHGDSRFHSLVSYARQRAASARTPK